MSGGNWLRNVRSLWRKVARRFRRLGLQRRIMLYVTLGLAVMFGVVAYLGLGAIDQATHLVFEERLTTAYTTAGILERDFERIAASARETAGDQTFIRSGERTGIAGVLLDRLQEPDALSPFFRVTGVWLLDADGKLQAAAGSPAPPAAQASSIGSAIVEGLAVSERIYRAVGEVPGEVPFAALAVRLGADSRSPVAVVHTASVNSSADYAPATYGRREPSSSATPVAGADERSQLEVVDPDGIAVLAIGSDQQPGEMSHHFSVIQSLMARGGAAALLHEPQAPDSLQPHVMAVVPLTNSPFYVIFEQPVDVALALPNQLRNQLFVWTAIGFAAALAFAWISTRHVVKPTEQLTLAAERMATGDLASPIVVNAQDEVGRLADSLDTMRVRLGDAYEAVERTNRELESRVAARTAQLGQVLRQTISAQEDERRRLARELHDETAQTLGALTIALDRARDDLADARGGGPHHVAEAKAIAVRLLEGTRRLILGLRPSVLDDLGLVPALRWYCESTFADTGVDAAVDAMMPAGRLPAHTEVALFRIVQEAINNVARHARARHLSIQLEMEVQVVRITVSDDGAGFDLDRVLARSGDRESVGLIGMQERVKLLNGRMEIRSAPGEGTTILVEAPVGDEVAA